VPVDDLPGELRRDVTALTAFGPRNLYRYSELQAAADWVEQSLAAAGHQPARQVFDAGGRACSNIEAEIRGSADGIVVVGAHYDSVMGSPGADDNASGVAALLAIARRIAGERPARTLRLVAFVNEEPPHFTTPAMGSFQYAKRCHERKENIIGMVSLETIGYYSDVKGSQSYPQPLALFYPTTGNFIGFAANLRSRSFMSECVKAYRAATDVPAEAAALPELVSEVGWSDQWSFWQFGWPAFMVTDTAPFRNPHYHMPTDTAETLDYDRFARVTRGLLAMTLNAAR
jgi:Zn-dependent M28 family amino/carboxypeptidase